MEYTYQRGLCYGERRGLGWACLAPNAVLWLLGLWLLALPAAALARRLAGEDPVHQRNVVTYLMGLGLKTVGLLVTAAATGGFVLGWTESLDADRETLANLFGLINLATLYVWEMIYRLEMHWSLTAHHLVTMFLVVCSSVLAYDFEGQLARADPADLSGMLSLRRAVQRIVLVEVLFAMTNQPALIALLMHRAGSAAARVWFRIAAVWELLSKNVRLLAIIPLYIDTWGSQADAMSNALRIGYPLLAMIIWAANMYMAWTLWQLSKRTEAPQVGDKVLEAVAPSSVRVSPRPIGPVVSTEPWPFSKPSKDDEDAHLQV